MAYRPPRARLSKTTGRVLLRVESRLPATVWVGGRKYANATVVDLSTSGIGFVVRSGLPIPESFELSFRPGMHWRPVRVKVFLRNRVELERYDRIGSTLHDLSPNEQRAIEAFIVRRTDIFWVMPLLSGAGFMATIDAALRAPLVAITVYYSRTAFGREIGIGSVRWKAAAYLAYAALALGAWLTGRRGTRTRYVVSMACAFPLFLYEIERLARHWGWQLGGLEHSLVFWWDALLALVSAAALSVGIAVLTHYFSLLRSLQRHLEYQSAGKTD